MYTYNKYIIYTYIYIYIYHIYIYIACIGLALACLPLRQRVAVNAEGRFLAHWDEFVEHRKEVPSCRRRKRPGNDL